jgi:hypothetical protein
MFYVNFPGRRSTGLLFHAIYSRKHPMKRISRRTAIVKTAALTAAAVPAAAALAGTKKQTPKIARTMWQSGWHGDLKIYTELTLVPSPEALADLMRQHPHMARWDTVQIGGQLLVLEPRSSSMKRIDASSRHPVVTAFSATEAIANSISQGSATPIASGLEKQVHANSQKQPMCVQYNTSS